ncbi:hypothetical protein CRENPOLYSF2_3350004 [Crenothrix polyspora]|uniref:Uncharacterized protein n=1 Tax=Crenothrix polyspora TaxID=360316 RepID=A0A1R4HBA0_9GAMM|nr:hypothetical protein CRENPOLYSF2_3350004 [Crenothrix polyspora]
MSSLSNDVCHPLLGGEQVTYDKRLSFVETPP